MSTPKELFNRYVKEICVSCTKEGDCNIHITQSNGKAEAKCLGYKQLDYCMKHKCNQCKKYLDCFKNEKSNS